VTHAFDNSAWIEVARIAAVQHGRVTVVQLREAGLRRGAIQHAVRTGHLHREHHGVFAVGHQAPWAHGRWMSAVLACGAGAALSHRSAATLWRIRRAEGPEPDVTAPGRRARDGIATHVAPTDDATIREGIRVTTVARTIADLAHVIDEDDLRRTVREAQFLKLFHLKATQAAAERRPSTALSCLLEDMTVTSSELDAAFIRLLARNRIPLPVGQRSLLGHKVDYVWVERRVAVELDGYNAHVSLDAFQRDRTQSNALQLAGWVVLRFTWADVHRRPGATIAAIRRAL
jgi:very-short-patch-repair endonuclease